MADLLITNIGMPKKGKRLNLTILSDGSVIEHFHDAGVGKWSSYRSGGVKAKEIPHHGNLKDTDELQEALSLVLSLVMTPDLTDKEIGLVQRTISAVSGVINDMDTVLEASK